MLSSTIGGQIRPWTDPQVKPMLLNFLQANPWIIVQWLGSAGLSVQEIVGL